MKQVQKFKVELGRGELGGAIEVAGAGAKFLHFADQRGQLCVWFEVEKGAPYTRRILRIFATDADIPSNLVWLGTCQQLESFVWHLYEEKL